MSVPANDHSTDAATRAYDWSAFAEGVIAFFGVPGLVLLSSFLGFGALVRSLGLPVDFGWYTTLFIWALPGQVVYLTMYVQGASLIAIALGVTLTAVRLLPMVMLVLSKSRQEGQPRWPEYLLAHFIAVTLWVIANRSMEGMPRERRLPWSMGMGSAMVLGMMVAVTIGYYLADEVPPLLAIALVFMTPVFLGVSLVNGASYGFDYLAIVLGAALTPLGMIYFPQIDLLVAGLVGGLAAFILMHPRRRRRSWRPPS